MLIICWVEVDVQTSGPFFSFHLGPKKFNSFLAFWQDSFSFSPARARAELALSKAQRFFKKKTSNLYYPNLVTSANIFPPIIEAK